MLGEGTLTIKEFAMLEPLPLATIQDAVFEFLQGREDAVVYGAQAVNAYSEAPRMTQDVDILSNRAPEFAEELRVALNSKFHISVRVRQVKGGVGFRLYQVRKPKNRHLVDIRFVDALPKAQRVSGILVMSPTELVASKVIALVRRRGRPKSGTDWRDVAVLLLTFPELKRDPGPVTERLTSQGADAAVLATWKKLVEQELLPEDEDADF